MVKLHEQYKDQGFVVMGFPSDEFGGQELKTEEKIKEFVTSKFNVQFNMFSKISVTGDDCHPVYQFLKTAFPGDPTWNFSSYFLVNREGVPVKRYERESWSTIQGDIEELLSEKSVSPNM